MDGQSRDNQNFSDRWVTKFSKVRGSTRAPSARRSSAIMISENLKLQGITIYCGLDFNVHISNVCKKASQRVEWS